MGVDTSHSSCSANFEIRTTEWAAKRKKESGSSHGLGMDRDDTYWSQIISWWMSHKNQIRGAALYKLCSEALLTKTCAKALITILAQLVWDLWVWLIQTFHRSGGRQQPRSLLTDTKPINFRVQRRLLESPGLELNYFTHTNQSKVTLPVLRGATYISQWTNA